MSNFVFLKSEGPVSLLIDEKMYGIKIWLQQQNRDVGNDLDIPGVIILDIPDSDQLKIEYLSSFQILKRKIEASVYNK